MSFLSDSLRGHTNFLVSMNACTSLVHNVLGCRFHVKACSNLLFVFRGPCNAALLRTTAHGCRLPHDTPEPILRGHFARTCKQPLRSKRFLRCLVQILPSHHPLVLGRTDELQPLRIHHSHQATGQVRGATSGFRAVPLVRVPGEELVHRRRTRAGLVFARPLHPENCYDLVRLITLSCHSFHCGKLSCRELRHCRTKDERSWPIHPSNALCLPWLRVCVLIKGRVIRLSLEMKFDNIHNQKQN